MRDLRSIFFEAALLVVCGCLLGLAVNYQLVFDAFAGRVTPEVKSLVESTDLTRFPTPVLLEEVKVLREKGAVLVDARPSDIYALGHIDGARSLPMLDLDKAFPFFSSNVDRQQTVVTYCSGYGCQDSFDLAMLLIIEGYQDVRIYEGGFPEWQEAGLAVKGGGA